MSFFFQQPFHYQQPYQQYYQTPSPFGSPFGNHPQQQQYGYQSPPHNHYYESSDDDEREGVEHQLVQLSDGSLVLRPISTKKNTHTQRTQHQLEQERLYEKQRRLGIEQQQQQQRLHEQRQREEAQLEAQERIRQQQQKEQEDLLRSLFGCYNKRQPQQTQQTQPTRQPTKPQQTTKPTVNTSQPKPNTTTQKPSQQHTKPTTPNPINTNLTPVLPPLPQKKTNTKFTTTVSDEVEDETPVSDSDCNGQCDDDSYDPYDVNSPLIIDVPAPEVIITEQTDDKVETPTSQIEKKLKVEQPTPEPTLTTQQELPLEVPITPPIHKRNEEHIKTETPIEESNQSKIDLEVNNANEALLTRLFEQTERLYNKRSLLLTKIKSLGPQQQQYSTSLQKNLKQLDALIEQTHKYTQELLDSDDLV